MIGQAGRLNNSEERAGYVEFHGEHIFSVLHTCPDPVARVLLTGPFASERYFSWVPWVFWGRFLAAHGIEALRFDYRGVGESTGKFEDFGFNDWNKEVEFLARFLQSRSPKLPLILHGLELGAVFASKAFAAAIGDAMLLWSAPASANQALRRPLARHGFKNMFARKSAVDYIRELETTGRLEVEGYTWSDRLWRESNAFLTADVPSAAGTSHAPGAPSAYSDSRRPVRVVSLEGTPASVLKGSALGSIVSVNLDLKDLYTENLAWLMAALPAAQERL